MKHKIQHYKLSALEKYNKRRFIPLDIYTDFSFRLNNYFIL